MSQDAPAGHPGEDPADDRYQALVDEFLDRHRRGENPSIEDYARAHPALAERVRAYFPFMLLLERRDERKSDGPRLLGDYTILREIGRGGMGIVYEAEQRSLQRRVALKVLPDGSRLDPRMRERFQREVLAAAKLRHPHIVPVYDVGEDQGTLFFSMQLVGGTTLGALIPELRRLRSGDQHDGGNPSRSTVDLRTTTVALKLLEGPPSSGSVAAQSRLVAARRAPRDALDNSYFSKVAEIGRHVAEALSHAHAQGIIHEDIKPSNVLIEENGWVWVTDFGLAKALDLDDLTGSRDVVGTLLYMAPERFQGVSDPRSDIYGLGVTLYELATSQPPFDAADQAQLLKKICQEDPPDLRALDPAIPRDLEAIVLKAMSRSLEHRYGSSDELANDLTRFLAGDEVQVPVLRRHRGRRKKRAMVAGIAGLAAIAIAIAGWGLFVKPRHDQPIPPLSVPVGKFPQHAVAVDLDRDGRLDLAVADGGDDAITVLRSAGSRRFDARTFPNGRMPHSLASADFDGDRLTDLAAADVGSSEVSIYRGNGAGSLEPAARLSLPGRAFCVAAADLDGDGRPDLAVAAITNAVQMARNAGDLRFDPPTSWTVGPISNFVDAWDLNADGKLDLVSTSANSTTQHLAVLENAGGGRFKSTLYVREAPSASGAEAADFDGDGLLDLAGPSRTENDGVLAEYWLVRGRPSLEQLSVEALFAGSPVESLAAADLDQDGDVDLVSVGGDHDMAVLRNDGHGKFLPGATLETGTGPTKVLAVDLDGDRLVDLVTVNAVSGSVTIFFGRGHGFE